MRTVGIDAPGQLDPKFVFFPHLADAGGFMGFVGGVEFLALLFQRDAQNRLAKADPARRLGLLAHQIMALGTMTHRQNVIGKPRGLAPGRR